jgi:hypothetical protein
MSDSKQNKPIIAYWAIRGLAQPVRFLLEYAGTYVKQRSISRGFALFYVVCFCNFIEMTMP